MTRGPHRLPNLDDLRTVRRENLGAMMKGQRVHERGEAPARGAERSVSIGFGDECGPRSRREHSREKREGKRTREESRSSVQLFPIAVVRRGLRTAEFPLCRDSPSASPPAPAGRISQFPSLPLPPLSAGACCENTLSFNKINYRKTIGKKNKISMTIYRHNFHQKGLKSCSCGFIF